MESKYEIIVKEEPLWLEQSSTKIKIESEGHSVYSTCLQNNIKEEDQDSSMAPYDALALKAKPEIKEEICTQDGIKNKDRVSWEEHTQKSLLPTEYPILYTEATYILEANESTIFTPTNLEYKECLKMKCNAPKAEITDTEMEKNEHIDASPVENNKHSLCSEQQCKCEVCGKKYTRHNINHENTSQKCDICIKDSLSLSGNGIKNVLLKCKKPYKCEVCGKSFTKVSHLKEHVYIHASYRPHVCKVCGKGFIKPSDLKRHVLIHEDKRLHKCEDCGKNFALVCQLEAHNLCHDHKRYKCESCGKCFSKISHLKDHILIHVGHRPHSCRICKRSFTKLSDLKRHNLIHDGIKPHKCDVCDKSFTLTSQLKKHSLIHEKRGHKCDDCVTFTNS